MSNNPFLQSKSNRFNFLDSEETNKKSHIKDKKNNYEYESSANSFTKPSTKPLNAKVTFEDNTRKPVYKKDINHFKDVNLKNSEFTFSNELFPSLTPIVSTTNNNITSFKDALKHQNATIVIEDNMLQPGWVQISKVDNQIIINQDKLGPYDIKMQRLQYIEDDLNYNMNKTINTMQKKWLAYKINYDNIYGEDAYDNLHYLVPVYDSEYEDSDDYDTSLSDSDNNCYDNTEFTDY